MSVHGIFTTISGVNSMAILNQNLEVLRNFQPLAEEQIAELREAREAVQ
jgi:predicted aldo/keto reductase-like oxidoreductase